MNLSSIWGGFGSRDFPPMTAYVTSMYLFLCPNELSVIRCEVILIHGSLCRQTWDYRPYEKRKSASKRTMP